MALNELHSKFDTSDTEREAWLVDRQRWLERQLRTALDSRSNAYQQGWDDALDNEREADEQES